MRRRNEIAGPALILMLMMMFGQLHFPDGRAGEGPQHERVLGELSMARDLTLQFKDEELQNVTKASGPAPDGVGAKAVEGDDSGAGTTGLESPEDRTDNELTCE